MSNLVIVIALAVIAVAVYIRFFFKTSRDRDIDKAIQEIFDIKRRHHDLIVKALDDGASETQHISLLEDKRSEVLAQMELVEDKFSIEIDKTAPTEVGPVKVIRR